MHGSSAWILPLLFCAAVPVLPTRGQGSDDLTDNWVTVRPAGSNEPLLNPGMGLYLQYPPLDARADEWFVRLSGIAYYRLDWADVNPEPGVYTFDEYFGPIFDHWVGALGKRVAFRVMCENMHSQREYVTPKWVFDSGVPGVDHVGLYVPHQVDPVFWDDRYLDAQCAFVRKLGEYLEGRGGVEFVDIGSIGEWGEMHLGQHVPGRWTSEQLEQTGYSEDRYIAAYRRVVDAYREAFPRTRVFLNVGGPDHLTINDYAASRGMHFRQDGLKHDGASYNVERTLYPEYAPRGVLCNLEFFADWGGMIESGWDPKQAVETALASPLSYLNTNLFGGSGYRDAPPEAIELLTDAARRIGYRLAPIEVSFSPTVRVGPDRAGRLCLVSRWANRGTAAPHESLAVDWIVLDPGGMAVATARTYPPTPTTRWWPGTDAEVGAAIHLPAGLSPGPYVLALRVVDPERSEPIALALAGGDPTLAYPIAPIEVAPRAAGDEVVYEERFEAGPGGWSGSEGISVSAGGAGAHSGSGALLVQGTMGEGWNYAQVRVPGRALGGARYRLAAWVLVERVDPGTRAPYLKLASSSSAGEWLTNANTPVYDLRRLGEWQRLTVVTDVPPNAGSLGIAIEKGVFEGAAGVRLRLDDVSVEMVEGP